MNITSNSKIFLLPGFQNSLEGHWQTLWGNLYGFERIQQKNWNYPILKEWVESLNSRLEQCKPEDKIILVGHSLGCLTIIEWAKIYNIDNNRNIIGTLLVAVPQPNSIYFPKEANSFTDVNMQTLNFKSIVVASSNDKYADIEYAKKCASAWGSEFINIGNFGHINAQSNLGIWEQGIAYLHKF